MNQNTSVNEIHIFRPGSSEEIEETRRLFREYVSELGVPLCFQKFEEELAGLPGVYSPPTGALFLAKAGVQLAGCGALRRLDANTGEMKRLYVRKEHRRAGIGLRLAKVIEAEAKKLQYRLLRLDTLESLAPALALYQVLGFRRITAYYDNPTPGVIYLEKELT